MDAALLYSRLMDLAADLGVEVRTVAVEPPGGACRIRGRPVVMLSRDATPEEKVEVLGAALAELPGIEGRYLLPAVRDCLERLRRRGAGQEEGRREE